MGNNVLMEDTVAAWEGITSSDCLAVLDEIKDVLPVVLPAVVGFLAFRKAWGFLRSAIKGA